MLEEVRELEPPYPPKGGFAVARITNRRQRLDNDLVCTAWPAAGAELVYGPFATHHEAATAMLGRPPTRSVHE